MSRELRFLNDVAKPWDELNALLAKNFAFQPDLSSVTSQVSAIANVTNHQIDSLGNELGITSKREMQLLRTEVHSESQEARLVSDVSDVAKHVRLTDPKRQNSTFVAAMFEVNGEGRWRFLRNGVFVDHASLGCHDFMSTSLAAIRYWIQKRELAVAWTSTVFESNEEFLPTARLHFDSKYCIEMSSVRVQCYRRDSLGKLEQFDPPAFHIEIS